MPEASPTFVSLDVGEVIEQTGLNTGRVDRAGDSWDGEWLHHSCCAPSRRMTWQSRSRASRRSTWTNVASLNYYLLAGI